MSIKSVFVVVIWISSLFLINTNLLQAYSDSNREAQAKRIEELEFVLSPVRPVVYEGEDVWVRVAITSTDNEPHVLNYDAVHEGIVLERNGVALFSEKLSMAHEQHHEFVDTTYFLQINRFFSEPLAKENSGYRHLLPGRYIGFLKLGDNQYEFSFDIEAVPDEYGSLWDEFCRQQTLAYEINEEFRSSCEAIIDSANFFMDSFLARDRNSLFRSEALRTCLKLMGKCRREWSLQDSVKSREVLIELGKEEKFQSIEFYPFAVSGVLRYLNGDQKAEALLRLADATSNQAVIEDAQRRAENIRSGKQEGYFK